MQTTTYSRSRYNGIAARSPLHSKFRVLHTEEAIGSRPVSPTKKREREKGSVTPLGIQAGTLPARSKVCHIPA